MICEILDLGAMEVIGISRVSAHGLGIPPCSSAARVSNVKFLKFHSGNKNVPHMGLVLSHMANYCKIQPKNWGRYFQSRQEHFKATDPCKWPCKHASQLVVCSSVSQYQKNDVEDAKLIEKKIKKDLKVPVSSEVESLITTICDTTSIAEFKLNLAGFNLFIKRNLFVENAPMHAPSPPISTSAPAPVSNGSASSTSLAISKSKPSSEGIQRIIDTATDEGLAILHSPMVGFFRRSRTIKGKQLPPSCKENQKVNEGQVLCYIEQLGGEIPIESEISGEVIKILQIDGEPIGYGDALIAILPSFPGIKKLR